MKSKTLLLVGAAAVWCLAVTAALAEGTKGHADDRAAACASEAKALKGEERQKALAECAKHENGHDGNGNGHHSQQEKMKSCNVAAGKKDLHGDERRAFMSACLKG